MGQGIYGGYLGGPNLDKCYEIASGRDARKGIQKHQHVPFPMHDFPNLQRGWTTYMAL